MANTPQTYQRGHQDIRENTETFLWFWWWTKFGIVAIVLLLIFMAYMFT